MRNDLVLRSCTGFWPTTQRSKWRSRARPEPKFFMLDELYNQGICYYDSTYFAGKAGVRVRGEKITSYRNRKQRRVVFPAHFRMPRSSS